MSEPGAAEGTPKTPKPDLNRREMVGKWLEAGKSPEAVAMYGTSVENLRRIVQLGHIPPFVSENPQHMITSALRGEERVYYFLPVFNNLEKRNQKIARQLIARFAADDHYSARDTISWGSEWYEEGYRRGNAFVDRLQGILPRDVSLTSDFIEAFTDPDFEPDDLDDSQVTAISILRDAMKDPAKKDFIQNAQMRRGVTVYFSPDVFQGSQMVKEYEDDHEIILKRTSMLPLNSISGVSVYTKQEREELQSMGPASPLPGGEEEK